jgi:formate dehydrogenase major subunit
MGIEGEELAEQGIEWLFRVAADNYRFANPGRTVVIGGGSTAMDCCRTPLRLGAPKVICAYRRGESEMPAERVEVEEAMEEGVEFQFLTAPVKLRRGGNGQLILTCRKMALGEPDASGRRRPVPVEGSDFEIEADTVIAAIGQKTIAPAGVKTTRWGDLAANEASGQVEGKTFAVGDCATGAATVVEAVAGGRRAAEAVAAMLASREFHEPPVINVSRGHWRSLAKKDLVFLSDQVSDAGRIQPDLIPMERRRNSFDELFPTFTDAEVMAEGKRCIECGCTAKGECKLKQHSEEYGAQPDAITGEKILSGYDNRHPTIIHDRLKCIKCGICVKVCAEVVNQSLFSQKSRGFATKVETAFGRVLPDSCSACGACVEECPVGALDWKHKPAGL